MNKMVDTVKLLIPVHDPLHFDNGKFSPSLNVLVNTRGFGKAVLNPSPTYAKTGKYMPRLTMFKRYTRAGAAYLLAVEFSAPKMLYGNNFDELTESDFERLIEALQVALYELLDHRFFKHQLANAEVSAWHPSKNIVFLDYTACQTILNTIAKLDISRVYDLQKTNFRDGHVVHVHSNSLDIAFYDKMADLRKAKVSDKRAFEKNSLIQLNLLEKLEEHRPLEVFRFEVRYGNKAAVKNAFPQLEAWTFERLFKKELCRGALLRHWQKITASVDLLALDVKRPYELLQNYIEENQDATPQAAMAAVTGLLITSQVGASGLRNTLEARYGTQAWYRIKPLLKSPQPHRFKHFHHIDEALERFTPTNMSRFITNIANN